MTSKMKHPLPPRTLPPREDGSCDVHVDHGSAQPMLLQEHHVFPLYLQKRALKESGVAPTEGIAEFAALCGTGHDSVHVILRDLLDGDAPIPKTARVPAAYREHRAEWLLAYKAYKTYRAAAAAVPA